MTRQPDSTGSHVKEWAVEYCRNLLPPDRRRQIQTHLGSCPDCAAFLTLVDQLEQDVLRHGARHLRAERLVAISEAAVSGTAEESGTEAAGGLATLATPEELAHLQACASCRSELDWLRSVVTPPDVAQFEVPVPAAESTSATPLPLSRPNLPERRRSGRLLHPWAWGALGLAVAAVLLVVLVRTPGGPSPYTGLVHLEPLPPAQVLRGALDLTEYRRIMDDAMKAYAAGDYRSAEDFLHRARSLKTDSPEAALYLGSALLLQSRPREALGPLQDAVRLASSGRLQEESLWHLAQADLLIGDQAQAITLLRQVGALRRERQAAADSLLQKLAP